jgi:hypothetical protein
MFRLSQHPLFFLSVKTLVFWVTGLYLFGFVYFPIRFGAMDALLPSEIVGMVALSGVYFAWCLWSLFKLTVKLKEGWRKENAMPQEKA